GPRRRAARAVAGGSLLSQHGIPERGATGEIEDGRLSLAQVHQGDRRHTLSATSLALSGRGERGWLRGDGFTGPHDQFAGLDALNSRLAPSEDACVARGQSGAVALV